MSSYDNKERDIVVEASNSTTVMEVLLIVEDYKSTNWGGVKLIDNTISKGMIVYTGTIECDSNIFLVVS